MSKRHALGGLVLLLSLIVISVPAQSFEYWTNSSTLVYSDTIYTDPYSPKIACNEESNKCILLVYDNNVLATRGVKVIYSTNDFQGCDSPFNSECRTITTITHDYSDELTWYPHYNMPFDVVYNEDYQIFYIASKSTIYTYTPSTNTWATNNSISSYDCDGNAGVQYPDFLGFLNDTTALTLCLSWSQSKIYAYGYDIMGESLSQYGSASFPSTDPTTIEKLRGFLTRTTTFELDAHAESEDVEHAEYDSIGYSGDYLGLHHYFGDAMYYSRDENLTGNISGGIWYSESSDLVTFGNPVLKYAIDTSIAETINESDSFGEGQKLFLTWSRYSNSTGNGIYVYEETNKPVILDSNYNFTAILSTGSYSTNDYGEIFTLYTPSDEVNITFDSDKTPGTDTLEFDFSDCDVPGVTAVFENTPYDYKIVVRDALSNTVISTATVNFNGVNHYTDANGETEISIQPIQGAEFLAEQQGCHWWLYTDGTANSYYYNVIKTGYQKETGYVTPASKKNSYIGNTTAWNFEKTKTIYISPEGVNLRVHIMTEDGIEIYPESYVTYVTGNNGGTWTYKGEFRISRAYNNEYPARFLLFDNRSSYNVTVTLDYPVGTNVTETLEVEENEEYDVYVHIPYSLLELPCEMDKDCSPSFCDGSGFYNDFGGCQESVCSYETYDCIIPDLCDDNIGCFDETTEDECKSDLQCNNSCVSTYLMSLGLCGTDGFCKSIIKECSEPCNETVGVCQESVNCIVGNDVKVGWEVVGSNSFTSMITDQCDLSNTGLKECVHGAKFYRTTLQSLGFDFEDIRTYPSGWTAERGTDTNGEYIKLHDVVIGCSDECDVTVDFCPEGCSDELDECLAESPSAIGNSFANLLAQMGLGWIIPIWWYLLSIVVSVLSLIVMHGYGNVEPKTSWEFGGIILIIMVVIGILIPEVSFVNPFIGTVIGVIVALVLSNKLVPR